jgi:hypothetical protein
MQRLLFDGCVARISNVMDFGGVPRMRRVGWLAVSICCCWLDSLVETLAVNAVIKIRERGPVIKTVVIIGLLNV